MVILAFTFGTIVAMLLPIVTAIFALASTLAIIRLLGHVVSVPTVAPTLATMIGLGVGIDYALFIVTRHFRGLNKQGLDVDESIARAVATSGGAVFFAGIDGHDRARVARRGRHPAGHDDGADGCDRGGRGGARCAHAATGGAWDHRPAYQLVARSRPPSRVAPPEGGCGLSGRTRSPRTRGSPGWPHSRS